MMKRVFLYAYDRKNLGDDLFVHTITKRYPDVQFYIWTEKENRKTFACLPNLKVVDKDSALVHILRKLRASLVPRYRGWLEKRCDAVVYIGGSIFMEYPAWMDISNWWEYEAKNRPLYVLGANFGPWRTESYRARMEEIFRYCRDVCFRDRYSRDLFRDTQTVRCAPDILFSCPMPDVSCVEKQLFVSVIDCGAKTEGDRSLAEFEENYLINMARVLGAYLDRGWKIVLASFCEAEGDRRAIDKLLGMMEIEETDDRIRILPYDGTNAPEMTEAIAASEYVIASRFHGVILALAAGRPVFPVIYSDKTARVLEDLGFRGSWADLRTEKPIRFQESVQNLESGSPGINPEIPVQAMEQFAKLDELLKRGE